MKKKVKKALNKKWILASVLFVVLLIMAAIFLLNTKETRKSADPVYGDVGSIEASPAIGTHAVGEEFDVDILVKSTDGAWANATANVNLNNLQVTSMPFIDSKIIPTGRFELWTPPPGKLSTGCIPAGGTANGITNPSLLFSYCAPRMGGEWWGFGTGLSINLQESSTKLYTLRVKGLAAGPASITVESLGASMQKYDLSNNLVDILGSVKSGSYTIEEKSVNSCENNYQDGDETGVDCGGSCPDACTPPPPPLCGNGIKDPGEQDVDCGGTCAKTCPPPPATCYDKTKNGDETGVDCGGSSCVACQKAPTCSDGIKNGKETGVDCGGSCKACKATTNNTTPSKATVTPVNILETLAKATSDSEFRATWDRIQMTKSFILDVAPPVAASANTTSTALAGVRFEGKAYAGTKVHLFIFSTPIHKEAEADSGNDWKVTVDEPLATGPHNVYAVLVDKDGAITRSEKVQAINVDAATGSVKTVSSTSVAAPENSFTNEVETPAEPTKTIDSKKLIVIGGVVVLFIVIAVLVAYFIVKKKKDANYFSASTSNTITPTVPNDLEGPNFFSSPTPPNADNPIEQPTAEEATTEQPTTEYSQPSQNTSEPDHKSEPPLEHQTTSTEPEEEILITSDPLTLDQNQNVKSEPEVPSGQPPNVASSPNEYQFGHYGQSQYNQPNSENTNENDNQDQTELPK